jgi:hypothetical protein
VKQAPLLERLDLRGLTPLPSQVFGNVRLVPLVRPAPRDDLRIARRAYGEGPAVVDLGGGLAYGCTYVPHGLVIGWTDDGSPVASFGADLRGARDARKAGPCAATLLHRMAKREDDEEGGHRLRLVPQHLAFEGFLALCFGGPEITWSEYSKQAISRGLDPRMERSWRGQAVPGLEDALRMFEIHDAQCGVLLFVGDLLAEAFVVSHPDDYRDLHRTVLADCFADTLLLASAHSGPSPELPVTIAAETIASLAGLRAAVAQFRDRVGGVHLDMGRGLIGRPIQSERVYRAGPFSLQRFMTALDLSSDDHIGEAIVRDDGTLEYAKTYRLSAGQQKRAFLLKQLAAHGWNLDATAASLRMTKDALIVRIDRAGFRHLIAEHVLMAARKRQR